MEPTERQVPGVPHATGRGHTFPSARPTVCPPAMRIQSPGTGQEWDGGGRKAQEGGDMCIAMADSHCCTAETNKIL